MKKKNNFFKYSVLTNLHMKKKNNFFKYSVLPNLHMKRGKKYSKGLMTIGLIALILIALVLIRVQITGFAINENVSSSEIEVLKEQFNSSNANLAIKEPVEVSGVTTQNKNMRMEFDIQSGKVRLYFDLLNYSEFVENVGGELLNRGDIALNQSVNPIIDESGISNVTDISEEIINDSEDNITEVNVTEEIRNETETEISNATEEEANDGGEETVNESNMIDETEIGNITEEPNDGTEVNESITGNIIRIFAYPFSIIGRVIGVDEGNNTNISIVANETDVNASIENNSSDMADEDQVILNNTDIQEKINELNETEINKIADNSIIPAENFEVIVNNIEKDNAYKWGYKVKLKDLNFMAKIDVTSNDSISIYNEHSLKIGKRNILSFEDLVKAGYKVRFETPGFENNLSLKINVNKTMIEEILTELNITEENITIETNLTESNFTEVNMSETNFTEVNITEEINETNVTIINETEINVTMPEAESPAVNESQEQGENQTEQGSEDEQIDGGIPKEEEKEEKEETEKEKEEKKKGEKEEKESKEEKQEQKEEKKEETPAVPAEENVEQPIENEPEIEQETPAEAGAEEVAEQAEGITGSVIRFFRFTGRVIGMTGKAVAGLAGKVIGVDEIGNITEIEDIRYENTITVYIERDFTDTNNPMQDAGSEASNVSAEEIVYEDLDNSGNVSVGDIINLDPTLIIIPISDAEELDANRSYIRNIYNETSTLDNNWVLVNNSNYVRAVFDQALNKNNDITVYARLKDYFCNETTIDNITIEECPEISENETGKIEIYREDGNEVIATIENITEENYYKTYLDGLHGGVGLNENETSDVFDLKIVNAGNVFVNNSVGTVNINGNDVPYDIYQKKKRIDEIKEVLNQG